MKRLIVQIIVVIVSITGHQGYSQNCFVCTGNSATGTQSSAFGNNNSAEGEQSTVFGINNGAEGDQSTAFGIGNTAIGIGSFVVGQENVANDFLSISMGYNSTSTGQHSISIGKYCYSNGSSYTFGQNAKAHASQSLAIGRYVETTASGAIAFGSSNSSAPLINSVFHSLMIGFNSIYPTLFVSNSTLGAPYNKTGRIGVGNVTNPLAKLHIKADDGEPAAMFIQPNLWQTGTSASIALGSLEYGITNIYDDGLVFSSPYDFRFLNGKLGIGLIQYNDIEAKLHIRCGDGQDADLYIEPYKDYRDNGEGERFWKANLYLGTKEHGVMAHQTYGLVFDTEHDFIFREGVVAISSTNTENPATVSLVNNETYTWTLKNTFKGTENTALVFNYNGLEQMRLTDDGKLVVGQNLDTPDGYSLYVEDGILTEKVKVAVHGTANWMDHVFEEDYNLLSLSEVEKFIEENGHLPNIPSADEVVKEGVDLLEMNAKLLQKVEELTLYIIEQQKQIDELKRNHK